MFATRAWAAAAASGPRPKVSASRSQCHSSYEASWNWSWKERTPSAHTASIFRVSAAMSPAEDRHMDWAGATAQPSVTWLARARSASARNSSCCAAG